MVVQGDFEVQLVMVGKEDEELPRFLEHIRDGQVYIEVEPDKEYLVAVRRVGKKHNNTLLYTIEVDGKCLGWKYRIHPKDHSSLPHGGWTYSGQLQRDEHGNRGDRTLRFVTPRFTTSGTPSLSDTSSIDRHGSSQMGEIKVKIYDAIKYEKVLTPPRASDVPVKMEASPKQPSLLSSPKPVATKMTTDRDYTTTEKDLTKYTQKVRSGLGSTFISHDKTPACGTHESIHLKGATVSEAIMQKTYKKGHKVDLIVLKYATAPELIKAGVLNVTRSRRIDQEDTDKKQPPRTFPSRPDQILSSKPVKKESTARRLKKEAKPEKAPKKAKMTVTSCPIS